MTAVRAGAAAAAVRGLAALTVTGLVAVAGCGTSSGARETVTTVVTVSADAGGGHDPSATKITVVDPDAVHDSGAESETKDAASGEGPAGSPAGTSERSPGAASGTVSGVIPPTSASEDSPTGTGATPSSTDAAGIPSTTAHAGGDILATDCAALLFGSDISDALGDPLPSKRLRIEDVPNPDIGLTGKTRCYYGVSDLDDGRPLVLALAQYATSEEAADQLSVTARSEVAQGASARHVDVSGKKAQILLRDGGLLTTRVGTWTLSLAIADGVVTGSKAVVSALRILAKAALSRLVE